MIYLGAIKYAVASHLSTLLLFWGRFVTKPVLEAHLAIWALLGYFENF